MSSQEFLKGCESKDLFNGHRVGPCWVCEDPKTKKCTYPKPMFPVCPICGCKQEPTNKEDDCES